MDSSSEAFEKFSTWKNLSTSLRVTVIERGETVAVLFGSIAALDPDAEQVTVVLEMRRFRTFDVEGSVYEVEPTRVSATRDDKDWLVFEELIVRGV